MIDKGSVATVPGGGVRRCALGEGERGTGAEKNGAREGFVPYGMLCAFLP